MESVHTESRKKRPLHPAVAGVQTPGREYIILRETGQQIGCEEEGVAEIWMEIIGCNVDGVATK